MRVHAALRQAKPADHIPGGMLAIYINVGVLVAFFWLFGFANLLVDASKTNDPGSHYPYDGPTRSY